MPWHSMDGSHEPERGRRVTALVTGCVAHFVPLHRVVELAAAVKLHIVVHSLRPQSTQIGTTLRPTYIHLGTWTLRD